MVSNDLPQALDQLAFLGRSRDPSIRPILLRVMVDMFLQKLSHSETEVRQFEELIEHLLDDADADARLQAAEKLSRHPQTPRVLLDRFLSDRDDIAETVVAHATLEPETVQAAATHGSTSIATAAAKRTDLTGSTIRSLAGRPEREVLRALVENDGIRLDAAAVRLIATKVEGDAALIAKLLERTSAQHLESASLFLSATPAQRARIIAQGRRFDLGLTSRAPSATGQEALVAFERASRTAGAEGLDDALARGLGLTLDEIDAIRDDPHGEPLAICCAAAGVSGNVAARLFMLGSPAGAMSYFKIRSLTAIVETVAPRTALRLLHTMLGRRGEAPRRPAATPAIEAPVRRAAAVSGRAEPAAPAERATSKTARAG